MRKVGLFGGAFDPIHKTHVDICIAAKEQLDFDEVWILIDDNPRRKEDVTEYQHRMQMVSMATRKHGFIKTDVLDYQKEGWTYGLNELEEIVARHKDTKFSLIIGIDALAHFRHWDNPERFCDLVTFAVVERPDQGEEILNELSNKYTKFKYHKVEFEKSNVSSKSIRHKIKQSLRVDDVDPKVIEYIKQEKLYE